MASGAPPGRELVRPPTSSVAQSGPLSEKEIAAFYRDGYVIARRLLPERLLSAAREAAPAVEAEAVGFAKSTYSKLALSPFSISPVFHEIAARSPIASAVAQLSPRSAGRRGLVALKDAYFRLQGGDIGCDFHVDDVGFWPCKQGQPGPGVNAWIALDDVSEDRGGLVVVPGSFTEDYLDCRKAVSDFGTCLMAQNAPELRKKLEELCVRPKFTAGDVIFCTRYLFHRGDPFVPGSQGAKGPGIARYTVRYMPGDAEVDEIFFQEGKIHKKDPVKLSDADEKIFPAVEV